MDTLEMQNMLYEKGKIMKNDGEEKTLLKEGKKK